MSKHISALVSEGHKLKETIKLSGSRLKEIESALIEAGIGDHVDGDGHVAKVIQPSSAITTPADLDTVRDLLGDAFSKAFEKSISFKPVKAFKEVVGALLDKRKAAKVIAACEVEKSAYVKWA